MPPLHRGGTFPPPELMRKTYQPLRARARKMLLQDSATDAPTPPYYRYPAALSAPPFMGLGNFVAGRIHRALLANSYLAAQASSYDENPDPPCPRCETEPETFQHAILTCPAHAKARDLLLKEASSLGRDASLWTELHLIRTLGEYISDTKTGFPPNMIRARCPVPSPSPPHAQD